MTERATLRPARFAPPAACLGLLLAAAAHPAVAAPACPARGPASVVTVVPVDAPVVYDQSHSSTEITGVGSDRMGGRTRGLTLSNFTGHLEVNYRVREAPGGFCMEVDDLKVILGYEKMIVYIENDWPRGSCQYSAVLEHEDKHVGINRGTFYEFLPSFKAALEEAAANPGFPYFAADKDAGVAALSDFLGKTLDGATARMVARRDQLNGVLDSPQSYAYTQQECPSW